MIHKNIVDKYIKLSNLDGIVKYNTDGYRARCPICGDSRHNKTKKRFLILLDSNKCIVYCHRCGYKTSWDNFLKNHNTLLYESYKKERFEYMVIPSKRKEYEEIAMPKSVPISLVDRDPLLNKLIKARNNSDALQWCMNRKLPEKFIDELYYSENYTKFLIDNDIKKFDFVPNEDPRVVIPFYKDDKLTFIQGRTIGNSKLRYMTNKLEEETKLWGLDKIDKNKTIYVCEGVFDACYIDNCIAMTSSNGDWDYLINNYGEENLVMIFDNDIKKNEDIKKIALKLVDRNIRLFLWPDGIKEKDVNEYIINGNDFNKLLIDKNIYSGLLAKTKIRLMK